MSRIHFMADDNYRELVLALRAASDARDPVTGDPDDNAFIIALAEHDICPMRSASRIISDRAADRDRELTRPAA